MTVTSYTPVKNMRKKELREEVENNRETIKAFVSDIARVTNEVVTKVDEIKQLHRKTKDDLKTITELKCELGTELGNHNTQILALKLEHKQQIAALNKAYKTHIDSLQVIQKDQKLMKDAKKRNQYIKSRKRG